MTGTLPKKTGDVEKIKACKRGLFSCCDDEFQIDVKIVEHLMFITYHHLQIVLDGIAQVTLFISRSIFHSLGRAKCKPGTSSESGYEPCRKSSLPFNAKPTIIPKIPTHVSSSRSRQLTFQCSGNYYSYRSLIFDIKYMIDSTEIPANTSNLSYNEILTRGSLKASDWTVTGRTLGFQIVNPQVTVIAGVTAKIYLVSTVPVACYTRFGKRSPCNLNFEMLDFKEEGNDACNRSTATKASACGLVMDGWRWNSQSTMSVTTLRNPKYQSDYTAIVKLRCKTGTIDSLWKNLLVPDVKVHVIHQPYRNSNSMIVNCAVAVQAASDVFIIYGCDMSNKWFIRRLNCDKSRGAYLELYERNDGREYEIHLPTGTRVKVTVVRNSYLDIDVFPSTAELGNSHGLCGDFNGRRGDDFVDRNGNRLTLENFKKHWSAAEYITLRLDSKTVGTTLLDDIVENDCPNDCNVNMTKRGNCVNGACQCFSGFAGDDCSISTNQPPALTATFTENKCDIDKTVCMEVPGFGTNFHKSLSLQCRIQEKELNHTDPGHIDRVHLITARMESFAEITCPLPDNLRNRKRRSTDPLSPKAFLISITTNGNSYSNQIPVIIFDSACSDCEIIGTSMKCNPKNNICVVQDKCYSLSSTMCGNTDSTNKSKSMLWIIGAALGGIAFTAIVIVVVAKLMLRKGPKTGLSSPDLSQSVIYQAPKSTKYPY
ncbi:unnamed protein product [Mytilus edulis]|uniref:VWFD domain-containing protein n=1 Tax=Mytilus edulis TaxID=6550 RepID=A0A8S3U2X2_MYTED|nr:unnamed protein product [Mytilus edulis]